MNDIEKTVTDNIGGANKLRFVPVSGIASIPSIYAGAIQSTVVLKAGYRWYDCYCTLGSLYYKDEQQDGEHGVSFKKEVGGSVPRPTDDLIEVFSTMDNGRFVLDVTDNNGHRRLIGTVEEPMYFKRMADTKAAPADKNEYRLLFSGAGTTESPGYNV